MADDHPIDNGNRQRLIDRERMARAAENATLKLSARVSMVLFTVVVIPLAGWVLTSQAEALREVSRELGGVARIVAEHGIEIKHHEGRIKNLERERRRGNGP